VDPLTILLVVAAATLLIPISFLILVIYAVGRRGRGYPIGPRLSGFVTVLGGMSIGVFLITGADDILVAGPIIGAAGILAIMLWRRRRRVQAGQLVLGASLPWATLWTIYVVASLLEPSRFDTRAVITWFSVGAAGVLAGLLLIRRGDPPPLAPNPAAPAGQPGSRSFGSISAAIREPGRVGPFGTSELAALVAFVVAWTVLPIAFTLAGLPHVVVTVVSTVIGAALGTEAYIRAMPSRSRRAFEAFSWLGEWELKQAGASLVNPIPTSAREAVEWLARHPETAENRWIRVEVLLLAGQFDEAKGVAERLPDGTPAERWTRAGALDAVGWQSGGDGDLPGLEAAAADLLPADGDDRLRAEVSIASAKVRRLMADGRSTPGDALEPLLAVRQRLGRRADGQVGRALRRRLFTVIVVVGLVLSAVLWIFAPGLGLGV
jgi:hypothetical protein